jgi:hypothetical protein
MTTTTHTKYHVKFEELADDQKSKVIDKNRNFNVDYDWHDFCIDDCKDIGSMLGFKMNNIFFSGFHSQGDGACFTGKFSYNKGFLNKIKKDYSHEPKLIEIATSLHALYLKSFYTVYGTITHTGHYSHERSMSLDIDTYFNDIKGHVNESEWLDIIADFACWIYKRLESEYEFQTSDEQIAESLIANEMEFEVDEDGKLV